MSSLTIRILPRAIKMAAVTPLRTFTSTAHRSAEGDTGSVRRGGEAQADSWTRREKAAENLYIKTREKEIMTLLREKIAAQEESLAKDRATLAAMEDVYGHISEQMANERASIS